MNSRWQANKTGLINFWYYDDQEFPFINGRMLLRGSNGSGKSVTMQSIVPLLLDGNMSPERLDPFGSRDRKMSSYLLEEDDEREERTGYLYLEFKRKGSDTYMTVGMGIKARKRKPLDKWYFSISDGRRVGKDLYLYKDIGEKVPLSKKELENRIADGGRVFDRQAEYMEYVNRQIFGFETVEEYKEMIDLLIQLRTPKLSKDFKPSVINDILGDSLQPLSDDDLRPMSEAIENMDSLSMNLKSREEARRAAHKINRVFSKYNSLVLYEKADAFDKARTELMRSAEAEKQYEARRNECLRESAALENERLQIKAKHDSMENEKESLRKSDAFALKKSEAKLRQELEIQKETEQKKTAALAARQEKYIETENRLKDEEDRQYEKKKEIISMLEDMQADADIMSFEEHAFFSEELLAELEKPYRYDPHHKQSEELKKNIDQAAAILSEAESLKRQKDEQLLKREKCIRELNIAQKKVTETESVMIDTENEWKEALVKWNSANTELIIDDDALREMLLFADSYSLASDFNTVRSRAAQVRISNESAIQLLAGENRAERKKLADEKLLTERELSEWEDMKDPEPPRSEAVLNNRKRLSDMGIPYQEFYKVIEFSETVDERECDRIEEALMRMGILDAVVVEEQYREKVLEQAAGCEDNYLFAGEPCEAGSLLDVLELNDDVNDLFSNQRLTGILRSISYSGGDVGNGTMHIAGDGSFSMGVITGTVTGEHEAGFLGAKARERKRKAMIEKCRNKQEILSAEIKRLDEEHEEFIRRKNVLADEYDCMPDDTDMKETAAMLRDAETSCDVLDKEKLIIEGYLRELSDRLNEMRKNAAEIAEKLYISCNYNAFIEAAEAASEYMQLLVGLRAAHEIFLNIVKYINDLHGQLENIKNDMDDIRYDLTMAQRNIQSLGEEYRSVVEQLKMKDYEEIKERLEACIAWLDEYPEILEKCVKEKTKRDDEAVSLEALIKESQDKISIYEMKVSYMEKCYDAELKLGYANIPEELGEDAVKIRNYLAGDVRSLKMNDVLSDLNNVYFENKGYLNEYNLTQGYRFSELESGNDDLAYSPKRYDLSAKYEGVKISFQNLITHLDEEISEIEGLIKDNDRELFENILANNVSRKIRGKINSSAAWVKKMNDLMGAMNTSSGLRLSLRWRSRTAEQEDQLDTKELVELLKKDHSIMSEAESSRLSVHFRSKIEEARRRASDGSGMISFYQIMKETLDYRKWFEFQLFSQKKGEKQKELTNSVFGTFSGGEKAMSMYVPLFSAVVAKYQGGRGDAPKLISLDEAFAGVDNRNIRDMFRLMTEFDFDFIINSQVLWGDCDTLDALAIYQLIRPENAKFVTVMPYVWNGHSKELMDDESSVERRGAELG